MELRYYFQLLLRGWWIILLTVIASLGAYQVVLMTSRPVYQVSIRFVISFDPNLIKLDNRIYSLDVLNRRSIIATYAEFLNSRRNLELARQQVDILPTDIALYNVSTVVLPDANVLELYVEGPNPYTAFQVADAIGKLSISQAQVLYQVYQMSVLDPPIVPVSPVHWGAGWLYCVA
jgi:uncharacterized protein involved in exopolysaccharide biosynthesis